MNRWISNYYLPNLFHSELLQLPRLHRAVGFSQAKLHNPRNHFNGFDEIESSFFIRLESSRLDLSLSRHFPWDSREKDPSDLDPYCKHNRIVQQTNEIVIVSDIGVVEHEQKQKKRRNGVRQYS